MEHIVQFAIGIDDDAIVKRIKESSEKQITDDITKQVRSEIEREIFEMYKGPFAKDEKIMGLQNWCKELVIEMLNENQDKIIELAAEKLADKMARTKAIKAAFEAMVTAENNEAGDTE